MDLLRSPMGLALRQCPLVASVQASEGSPLEDPLTLLRSAQASLQCGVKVLRLQGVSNISTIKGETAAFVIGLIKRRYDGEVYITPTLREVEELLETGCDAIAIDGTRRTRPNGEDLANLIKDIHEVGVLVMADIDSVDSARYALECGADMVSTTLSGYTRESTKIEGPDLDLIRSCSKLTAAVLAEGRFTERWQVEAALRAGAMGVVVGGAINDPLKNTRRLMPNHPVPQRVAAIDIGGTWVRAAAVDADDIWKPDYKPEVQRIKLPSTRKEKMDWIASFLKQADCERVGVSTGGIVKDNVVTVSKPTIPENVGTDFNTLAEFTQGNNPLKVIACDDGHATAWSHACHPDFACKNIAVLTLGTGVGFGFVREGKIAKGPQGQYTRINDTISSTGQTYEEILGGLYLTPNPSEDQIKSANKAIAEVFRLIATFLFPDVIIISGTVGIQLWLNLNLQPKEGFPVPEIIKSPFGADAGIYGAAAIALYPPDLG